MLCRRVLHETFEMRHRQTLLVVRSRQLRVAGIAQTQPSGGALIRLPSARRAFRRRWASIADESRCDPRLRLSSPRQRSGRSRVLRVMVFGPSRPSVGSARKERGLEPRAVNQIGTRPPGRWRNARRSTAPAPQSKPVTPASRLVAQVAPSVASGLGLSVPAAGPARHPHYSCCGRLCEQTSKPARTRPS